MKRVAYLTTTIMKNKVWKLVSLPSGRTEISYKWVFKHKRDNSENCTVQGSNRHQGFQLGLRSRLPRYLCSSGKVVDLAHSSRNCGNWGPRSSSDGRCRGFPAQRPRGGEQQRGFIHGNNLVCKFLKSLYVPKQAPMFGILNLACFVNIGFRRSEGVIAYTRFRSLLLSGWTISLFSAEGLRILSKSRYNRTANSI